MKFIPKVNIFPIFVSYIIYNTVFTDRHPARSTVQVAALPKVSQRLHQNPPIHFFI